jgi:hypothetical protein
MAANMGAGWLTGWHGLTGPACGKKRIWVFFQKLISNNTKVEGK